MPIVTIPITREGRTLRRSANSGDPRREKGPDNTSGNEGFASLGGAGVVFDISDR
jgi:hypothetical protein